VLDPWLGSPAGVYDTLAAIEAAMPGLLARIRELQNSSKLTTFVLSPISHRLVGMLADKRLGEDSDD
jgi:hypothetical protein